MIAYIYIYIYPFQHFWYTLINILFKNIKLNSDLWFFALFHPHMLPNTSLNIIHDIMIKHI